MDNFNGIAILNNSKSDENEKNNYFEIGTFISFFMWYAKYNGNEKSEIREATGLFIIIKRGMNYLFYEVNKDETQIIAEYHFGINDRVIFSLDKISEPVNNLPNFTLLEIYGKMRFVHVKLTFHLKNDIKGFYVKPKNDDIYKDNKILLFSGYNEIKIDSIQVLDKEKEKIYLQTMDSLEKAKAPVFLYGV